jgi:hypothetical protein
MKKLKLHTEPASRSTDENGRVRMLTYMKEDENGEYCYAAPVEQMLEMLKGALEELTGIRRDMTNMIYEPPSEAVIEKLESIIAKAEEV